MAGLFYCLGLIVVGGSLVAALFCSGPWLPIDDVKGELIKILMARRSRPTGAEATRPGLTGNNSPQQQPGGNNSPHATRPGLTGVQQQPVPG